MSFFHYFLNASVVVQLIMLILLGISLVSWTIIFHHSRFLRQVKKSIEHFENKFWSSEDLSVLYTQLQSKKSTQIGTLNIFVAGFREFINLSNHPNQGAHLNWIKNVQRAMRVAHTRDLEKIEGNLNFLATVGSTSPYIGLLGTVWGIMNSFHSLGAVEQATIAMVAPGISEALVATALGLFAAIPAVISYNRFSEVASKLEYQYITFQEEFSNILLKSGL